VAKAFEACTDVRGDAPLESGKARGGGFTRTQIETFSKSGLRMFGGKFAKRKLFEESDLALATT
jgi:hypothetical protein